MRTGFDWILFLTALLIFILGFSLLFTQQQTLAQDQLKFFIFGLAVFFLLFFFDYHFLENFSSLFYFLSIFLLIINLFVGRNIRGSTRWLGFSFITFQTSEIVKPLLIVSAAAFLKKSQKASHFLLNILFFILPIILVFFQPDLGSALVLLFIFTNMIIFSKIPKILFLVFTVIAFFTLPFGFTLLKDYQKERLTTFLNPRADPLGANYNLIQSIISIGSGKIFGKGLGFGSQSQLKFLPERHTDFIFATLAEELGFFGTLFFLLVYFFLLLRILKIANSGDEEFSRSLVLGIFSLFFFQFLINVAMNLGILPVTGITLPLVSAGGSSLVACLSCLGIAESVVFHQRQRNCFEIK